MLLSVNGQDVAGADASHPCLSREFLLRGGIFETLRVYEGAAFKLEEHLDRLHDAARRMQINCPTNAGTVIGQQIARAGRNRLTNAFLRVTLTPESADKSTLVTMIDRLPDFGARFYDEGIRVLTSPTRRDEFASSAGIKTTAWLVSLLEFRAKSIPGAEDAILLDTKGHVSEGSASNIFVVIDGKLRTPPLSCGALPGITRAAVLSLAHAAGVASDDSTPIHPGEVVAADEVFLTSSIREIVPVISVDEQTIGTGKPGTITRSIMTAYRELTA